MVVVDVGCRWGFAEPFLGRSRPFHVVGFDPDAEECERLRERYRDFPVELVPLALAGKLGPRTLYRTLNPACSSLLQPDPVLTANYPALECAREVGTETVETTTLDAWARSRDLPPIRYLKLDTQGTELEILEGGAGCLRSVRCVEVEVEFNPIYLGQPLFSDVDHFLRGEGFVLWKLTNHVHYSRYGEPDPSRQDSVFYDERQRVDHATFTGQLYWANAHYVRKEMLEATQGLESQRRQDALLLDAIGLREVAAGLSRRDESAPLS